MPFPSQHHRHHLLLISDTSSGLLWAEVEANQDSWKSISRTMSQLNSAMRVSASEGANLPGSKLKTQGIADFGHSWYQNVATLQFFWYPIWTHTHLMCGFNRGCKQQKHQGVKTCQVFSRNFPGPSIVSRVKGFKQRLTMPYIEPYIFFWQR